MIFTQNTGSRVNSDSVIQLQQKIEIQYVQFLKAVPSKPSS